jgi:hypothetical protein
VEFSNGSVFKLSAEFLRINSPAVDGKIRSIGGEKVTSPFQSCWELYIGLEFGCDIVWKCIYKWETFGILLAGFVGLT